MRYYVTAAEEALAEAVAEDVRAAGHRVVETYEPADDLVVLTIGGDGAVLYAARQFESPTILPVVKPDSEGNTIQLDRTTLRSALDRIERGDPGEDYRIDRHRQLTVRLNGSPLREGYRALNDVTLQHGTPIHAAEFRLAVEDGTFEYTLDRVIGDGIVIATVFGATGYYRSIADGVFSTGVGIALSNVHKPADAHTHLVCSPAVEVTVEPATTKHAADLVVTRDNDPEHYTLAADDRVTVRLGETSVELLRLPGVDRRDGSSDS